MKTLPRTPRVLNPRKFIGSVGDSRSYLLRGQEISQLSYDDDGLNDMVRLKLISSKLATSIREKLDEIKTYDELRGAAGIIKRVFYDRNILSNMLGKQMRRKANIAHKKLKAGDILILTSDGVHDNLTNSDIKEILLSDNEDPAKKIVEEAKKISVHPDQELIRSKPDDISAVVVHVVSG